MAPAIDDAVKNMVSPTQTGLLLPAIGAGGVANTITTKESAVLVHPLAVSDNVYNPESATVALGIVGFWSVDVNELGPVQL